jgi:carboxypeptidase Q
MKKILFILLFAVSFSYSQRWNTPAENKIDNPVIKSIIDEATNNSQLENLAHELFDVVGPRLVGTPQMQQAHDWAVAKYNSWGIDAYNHEYGKWRGWERGITHIDMVEPRLRTLVGRQLAWSPSTKKKGVTAEVTLVPDIESKEDFENWLKTIKGKFVLVSQYQPTGRPDSNWEEFALAESFEKMKNDREEMSRKWFSNLRLTGYGYRDINKAFEDAGAVGLISSYWSRVSGANKVFSARTDKIPNIDVNLEDYGALYRLAKNGKKPVVKVVATSTEHGVVPTFNTIAQIKGVEKPDEYVILSAHFDSWDGGQGTTDNGTGTLVMLEAMRILKLAYPNPKRTILVGHWGGEEQGLNGSRAFVEDYPKIVENTQAVFNQDNGTGRVVDLSGQGFLYSYEFITNWLSAVPSDITKHIETDFPGLPGGGGSDYASFVAAGIPAFSLSSLSWDYGTFTWHTNLDTYDKIVFDDVRSNAILTAILAYKASEEAELVSREKRVMPINPRTGRTRDWPSVRKPNRDGSDAK